MNHQRWVSPIRHYSRVYSTSTTTPGPGYLRLFRSHRDRGSGRHELTGQDRSFPFQTHICKCGLDIFEDLQIAA
jgi:hypothetical protein